jgi:hypothetical protein
LEFAKSKLQDDLDDLEKLKEQFLSLCQRQADLSATDELYKERQRKLLQEIKISAPFKVLQSDGRLCSRLLYGRVGASLQEVCYWHLPKMARTLLGNSRERARSSRERVEKYRKRMEDIVDMVMPTVSHLVDVYLSDKDVPPQKVSRKFVRDIYGQEYFLQETKVAVSAKDIKDRVLFCSERFCIDCQSSKRYKKLDGTLWDGAAHLTRPSKKPRPQGSWNEDLKAQVHFLSELSQGFSKKLLNFTKWRHDPPYEGNAWDPRWLTAPETMFELQTIPDPSNPTQKIGAVFRVQQFLPINLKKQYLQDSSNRPQYAASTSRLLRVATMITDVPIFFGYGEGDVDNPRSASNGKTFALTATIALPLEVRILQHTCVLYNMMFQYVEEELAKENPHHIILPPRRYPDTVLESTDRRPVQWHRDDATTINHVVREYDHLPYTPENVASIVSLLVFPVFTLVFAEESNVTTFDVRSASGSRGKIVIRSVPTTDGDATLQWLPNQVFSEHRATSNGNHLRKVLTMRHFGTMARDASRMDTFQQRFPKADILPASIHNKITVWPGESKSELPTGRLWMREISTSNADNRTANTQKQTKQAVLPGRQPGGRSPSLSEAGASTPQTAKTKPVLPGRPASGRSSALSQTGATPQAPITGAVASAGHFVIDSSLEMESLVNDIELSGWKLVQIPNESRDNYIVKSSIMECNESLDQTFTTVGGHSVAAFLGYVVYVITYLAYAKPGAKERAMKECNQEVLHILRKGDGQKDMSELVRKRKDALPKEDTSDEFFVYREQALYYGPLVKSPSDLTPLPYLAGVDANALRSEAGLESNQHAHEPWTNASAYVIPEDPSRNGEMYCGFTEEAEHIASGGKRHKIYLHGAGAAVGIPGDQGPQVGKTTGAAATLESNQIPTSARNFAMLEKAMRHSIVVLCPPIESVGSVGLKSKHTVNFGVYAVGGFTCFSDYVEMVRDRYGGKKAKEQQHARHCMGIKLVYVLFPMDCYDEYIQSQVALKSLRFGQHDQRRACVLGNPGVTRDECVQLGRSEAITRDDLYMQMLTWDMSKYSSVEQSDTPDSILQGQVSDATILTKEKIKFDNNTFIGILLRVNAATTSRILLRNVIIVRDCQQLSTIPDPAMNLGRLALGPAYASLRSFDVRTSLFREGTRCYINKSLSPGERRLRHGWVAENQLCFGYLFLASMLNVVVGRPYVLSTWSKDYLAHCTYTSTLKQDLSVQFETRGFFLPLDDDRLVHFAHWVTKASRKNGGKLTSIRNTQCKHLALLQSASGLVRAINVWHPTKAFFRTVWDSLISRKGALKAITSRFQDMGCRDKEEEIIFFAHVLLADLEQSCVMPYGDHYGADDIAYGNGYKYFCGRFSEMPSSNKEEVAKGLFRFVAGIEDEDVLLALGYERVSPVQADDSARGVQDIITGQPLTFSAVEHMACKGFLWFEKEINARSYGKRPLLQTQETHPVSLKRLEDGAFPDYFILWPEFAEGTRRCIGAFDRVVNDPEKWARYNWLPKCAWTHRQSAARQEGKTKSDEQDDMMPAVEEDPDSASLSEVYDQLVDPGTERENVQEVTSASRLIRLVVGLAGNKSLMVPHKDRDVAFQAIEQLLLRMFRENSAVGSRHGVYKTGEEVDYGNVAKHAVPQPIAKPVQTTADPQRFEKFMRQFGFDLGWLILGRNLFSVKRRSCQDTHGEVERKQHWMDEREERNILQVLSDNILVPPGCSARGWLKIRGYLKDQAARTVLQEKDGTDEALTGLPQMETLAGEGTSNCGDREIASSMPQRETSAGLGTKNRGGRGDDSSIDSSNYSPGSDSDSE